MARVSERKFLGYRLLGGGRLTIASESLARAKERIRGITRRNRGVSLDRVISELNSFLTGWVTCFRYASVRKHLQRLDEWVRRKLRCVRLKQRKGGTVRYDVPDRPRRARAASLASPSGTWSYRPEKNRRIRTRTSDGVGGRGA